MNTKALPLSTRAPLPGYRAVKAANPDEVIEVTIKLRRIKEISDQQVLELASKSPAERTYLTQEELAKTYGASTDDMSKIEEFAHEHGLAIASELTRTENRRSVHRHPESSASCQPSRRSTLARPKWLLRRQKTRSSRSRLVGLEVDVSPTL